ncbi:DUF6932 family protein [Flavitalea flava]
MNLSFNSKGYLYQTESLNYDEFIILFGTNHERMQQINNALHFFKIFYRCGCGTVYIDGSFVSKKKYPEDIDMCFDISTLNEERLKNEFPQFFDPNELGKIHKKLKCHIFYFTEKNTFLLDMLKEDRDGNGKGLIKLDLNNLDYYD